MTKLHVRRFAELAAEAEKVEATTYKADAGIYGAHTYVNGEALDTWKVKAQSLIANACGRTAEHYSAFIAAETTKSMLTTNRDTFHRLRSVFNAAREDYEGGYLTSTRTLVQAEIFDTELEQAAELLSKGFKVPAAVIAGTVLETALRELCDRNKVPHGKLDRMNADLAKAEVYSLLTQKRITALAQIRNDAAHGKPDQFKEIDVRTMIADVERFLSDFLVGR